MTRELIESWNDYHSAADRLLTTAQHSLQIFDEDLAALKLESTEHLASLSTLLARHADHPLRIALRTATHFQTHSPRLQNLFTTWAHRAEVRQVPPALTQLRDSILIVDGKHALIRLEKDLPRSVLILDDTLQVAPYARRFDELWQESDINLLQKPLGL
jgi:hypothetical protein